MKLTEESAARTGQKQSSKKRSRKEVAIFGNYWNYYGYRVGQDLDEDPRLRMMKREWFEGKDCLDIGCNSGLITIASFINATLLVIWTNEEFCYIKKIWLQEHSWC